VSSAFAKKLRRISRYRGIQRLLIDKLVVAVQRFMESTLRFLVFIMVSNAKAMSHNQRGISKYWFSMHTYFFLRIR